MRDKKGNIIIEKKEWEKEIWMKKLKESERNRKVVKEREEKEN